MGPITRTAGALAVTAAVAVVVGAALPGAGTANPPRQRRAPNATAPVVSPTELAVASTARPGPLVVGHGRSPAYLKRVGAGPIDQPALSNTRRIPVSQAATPVAGGIASVPSAAPTSVDPRTFDFKGLCTEEWTGDWVGASACNITKAHYDVATGDFTASITDSFIGVYSGDHTGGTLTIDETVAGNVIRGSGTLEGRIVSGSGDPTFRCSSGTITMSFYLNLAFVYGGYSGTWRHGCTRMTGNV